MHYETLNDNKKLNIDMSNVTFQPSLQITEVNRTRTGLLCLTTIQYVVSVVTALFIICSHVLDYTWGYESYDKIVQLLPFLSLICFGFGLIATKQYHARGLLLFSNLILIDILISYLILTIFVIKPIVMAKYEISIFPAIIIAMSYFMIFIMIALLPAYTSRAAHKLSTLLADNQCLITK